MKKPRRLFLAIALLLAALIALPLLFPGPALELCHRHGPAALRPWVLRRLVARGDESFPHVWSLIEDQEAAGLHLGGFRARSDSASDELRALEALSGSKRGLGAHTRAGQLEGLLLGLRSQRPELRRMALERLALEDSGESLGSRLRCGLAEELRRRRNAAIIAALREEQDPSCLGQIQALLTTEGFETLPALLEAVARSSSQRSATDLFNSDIREILDRMAAAEPARFEAWLEEAAGDPAVVRFWVLAHAWSRFWSEEDAGSGRLDHRIIDRLWVFLESEDTPLRIRAARLLRAHLGAHGPIDTAPFLRPLTRPRRKETARVIEVFFEAGLVLDEEGFVPRALAAARSALSGDETARHNAALALVEIAPGLMSLKRFDELWPRTEAALLELLEDEALAKPVLTGLPRYASERLIAAARAHLDHPELGLRLAALGALQKASIPVLPDKGKAIYQQALASNDKQRWSLVLALLKNEELGAPMITRVLDMLARARGELEPTTELVALRKAGGDELFRQALNHKDPAIREGARKALDILKDPDMRFLTGASD